MYFLSSLALNDIFLEKGEHLRLHGLKIKIYELFSLWMLCKIKRKLNYAEAYLLRFFKYCVNTNALCVMAIHFTR